ncbi:MAG: dTMP kinase [Clostridiaceae bacterium]|nr:dTMP kinase [Clostridiaceae bacterium]
MNDRGCFITFEGVDGTGKTTHIEKLAADLKSEGKDVVMLREPGGTQIGEQIRQILLKREHQAMADVSELLLFAAARAQLVREVIRPALEQGKHVLCDRFIDSTVAYQGYGRGLDIDLVQRVNNAAVGETRPDLTIWIDIEPEELAKRLGKRNTDNKSDRLDLESNDFRDRVRTGYVKISEEEPGRVVRVISKSDIRDTYEQIISCVRREIP